MSVAAARSAPCRLEAISGVDAFDRRAPAVRALAALIVRAAAVGEPLWSDQLADDTPPEIAEPLEAYCDESHVRAVGILPLCRPDGGSPGSGRVIGALAFEQFTEPFGPGRRAAAEKLGRQACAAIRNALEYESLPLRPLSLALRRAGNAVPRAKLPRTALIALALVLAVLLLAFVKTDFTVTARGSIQPLDRRQVFAPGDGVVEGVEVRHGGRVRAGQPLLQIRDQQLDWEQERVLGEMLTARQRLSAIEAERIDAASSITRGERRFNRMTSEEEELKQLIGGLEKQLALLDKRREELTVRSPIAGEVITWNVRQLLGARPVSRGQVLLSVAETGGRWVLELEVPEEEVTHVDRAREKAGGPLPVDYVLATRPGDVRSGRLARVARSALAGEHHGRTVSARVNVPVKPGEVTPGVTAVAEIHCGRRSLAYVWFRDLIAAVYSLWTP